LEFAVFVSEILPQRVNSPGLLNPAGKKIFMDLFFVYNLFDTVIKIGEKNGNE
jgi:hypothetical protein